MEHINNIKSHAQTLCRLIVVTCKTIESLTCIMANFGYHIFYLKNNKPQIRNLNSKPMSPRHLIEHPTYLQRIHIEYIINWNS